MGVVSGRPSVSTRQRRWRRLRHDIITRRTDDDRRRGCWSYLARCSSDQFLVDVVYLVVDDRHNQCHAPHHPPVTNTTAASGLPIRRYHLYPAVLGHRRRRSEWAGLRGSGTDEHRTDCRGRGRHRRPAVHARVRRLQVHGGGAAADGGARGGQLYREDGAWGRSAPRSAADTSTPPPRAATLRRQRPPAAATNQRLASAGREEGREGVVCMIAAPTSSGLESPAAAAGAVLRVCSAAADPRFCIKWREDCGICGQVPSHPSEVQLRTKPVDNVGCVGIPRNRSF